MDEKTRSALDRVLEALKEEEVYLCDPSLKVDVQKLEKWLAKTQD